MRNLSCSSCGADTGCWEQWYRTEDGLGLCGTCSAWMEARWPNESLEDAYGKPGVNRPHPTPEPMIHLREIDYGPEADMQADIEIEDWQLSRDEGGE